MRTLVIYLLMLLSFACSPTMEASRQPASERFAKGATQSKSYRATPYGKISGIDTRKPNGEHLEPPSEAFNFYKFDNAWQEADQKVKAYLEKNKEYSLHLQEQMLSCIMLDEYLLRQKDSKAVGEAIGFYVELLMKNENSEVLLLSQALQRLESHWDKGKIQTYRQQLKTIAQSLLTSSSISYEEKQRIKSTF